MLTACLLLAAWFFVLAPAVAVILGRAVHLADREEGTQ